MRLDGLVRQCLNRRRLGICFVLGVLAQVGIIAYSTWSLQLTDYMSNHRFNGDTHWSNDESLLLSWRRRWRQPQIEMDDITVSLFPGETIPQVETSTPDWASAAGPSLGKRVRSDVERQGARALIGDDPYMLRELFSQASVSEPAKLIERLAAGREDVLEIYHGVPWRWFGVVRVGIGASAEDLWIEPSGLAPSAMSIMAFPVGVGTGRHTWVDPLRMVASAAGCGVVVLFAGAMLTVCRYWLRRWHGACVVCGYNVANPAKWVNCPECGSRRESSRLTTQYLRTNPE